MQELLNRVLNAPDVKPDPNSILGRVNIPQCPKFSNELCQTWAKVNSRFHLSSQCKPLTFMASPEGLGLPLSLGALAVLEGRQCVPGDALGRPYHPLESPAVAGGAVAFNCKSCSYL